MQADLHTPRPPDVLIIYFLPVLFVCNASFLLFLLYLHIYKHETDIVNVCTCRVSLRNDYFLGDTFDVLCFHMYKFQPNFFKTSLCPALYWIGENHICTNPNQISILRSGGNLQLPRAKKKKIPSFKSCRTWWHGPATKISSLNKIFLRFIHTKSQHAGVLPLEVFLPL